MQRVLLVYELVIDRLFYELVIDRLFYELVIDRLFYELVITAPGGGAGGRQRRRPAPGGPDEAVKPMLLVAMDQFGLAPLWPGAITSDRIAIA